MNEEQAYYDQTMSDAYNASLKQGEGQDPNSIYGDYMREEKIKNVIGQLNPDTLVEDIEHRIRGEKKNSYSGEWEKINKSNPMQISDRLVEKYVSFLSSVLNQNTSLSNFSAQEINNLMGLIVEFIRDDLSDNAEEYGLVETHYITVPEIVKRKETIQYSDGIIREEWIPYRMTRRIPTKQVIKFHEMTRIGMIICGTTFAVFKRAQNGMEARRIFSSLRVSESLNQGASGKKGIMDSLKFWS